MITVVPSIETAPVVVNVVAATAPVTAPVISPSKPLSDLTGPEKVVRAMINPLYFAVHRPIVSASSAGSVYRTGVSQT
jgi:uncharacterized membrane-anchored protein YitT (DUF2179 family)